VNGFATHVLQQSERSKYLVQPEPQVGLLIFCDLYLLNLKVKLLLLQPLPFKPTSSFPSIKTSSQGSFYHLFPLYLSLVSAQDTTLPQNANMDPVLFFSTSARAKSFLEFPVEVRSRIYRLAIYDHDRAAVFLPRSVPRKVTLSEDVDLARAWVESPDGGEPENCWAFSLVDGPSKASGDWQPLKQALPKVNNDTEAAPNDTLPETVDGVNLDKLHRNLDYNGEELDEVATVELCGGQNGDVECFCSCHDGLFVEQERPAALECCPGATSRGTVLLLLP
jgi:hypothetical protein